MEHSEGLIDLGSHSIGGVKEVNELRVVHLEQHASDLASKLGLGSMESGISISARMNKVQLTEQYSCK